MYSDTVSFSICFCSDTIFVLFENNNLKHQIHLQFEHCKIVRELLRCVNNFIILHFKQYYNCYTSAKRCRTLNKLLQQSRLGM